MNSIGAFFNLLQWYFYIHRKIAQYLSISLYFSFGFIVLKLKLDVSLTCRILGRVLI